MARSTRRSGAGGAEAPRVPDAPAPTGAAIPKPVEPSPEPTLEELEGLARAVEDALPGVQIKDRALEFDDGTRADLAGVDSAGRLVLVRLADGDGDSTALGVLDLLALARQQGELVARHLGVSAARAAFDPRVIVVLEPQDRSLAGRLAGIASLGAGLELFDLRTVKSAAEERAYLVARGHGQEAVEVGDGRPALERFLDALPPQHEELGRELCDRLARLDDELRTEAKPDGIAWYFRDRPLVRLEAKRGRLKGTIGSEGRPQELAAARDADELLEAALSRLIEEVGRGPAPEPEVDLPRQTESPLALLSAEEIEAFRE